MEANVEELTASLVREYLSRKGLKSTLSTMDCELPRTDESISNRSALAKQVHIEYLMKKNKTESSVPYKSMLEVVVDYITKNPIRKRDTSASPIRKRDTSQSPIRMRDTLPSSVKTKHTPPSPKRSGIPRRSPVQSRKHISKDIPLDGNPITLPTNKHVTHQYCISPQSKDEESYLRPSIQKAAVTRAPKVTKTGLSISGSRKPHVPTLRTHKKLSESLEPSYDDKIIQSLPVKEKSIKTNEIEEKEFTSHDTSGDMRSRESGDVDLLCEDLELSNFMLNDSNVSITSHTQLIAAHGKPIDIETAQTLREIVFGTAVGPSFNDEWRRQGFTFQDIHQVTYGLIQHKGGPCGVLACVQAYILKYILFCKSDSYNTEIPELTHTEKREALVDSFSSILWKTGETRHAVVTLKPHHSAISNLKTKKYWPDQITELLIIYEFTEYSILKSFINEHIEEFTIDNETSYGCILLLYSVVLSRGIQSIKFDMDDEHNYLIGSHGYCTQELVNLLLTGKGSSNVFDGQALLESVENGPILRGINSQSEIGFLTLYEHYGSCQVGNNYKFPVYPVWIICSESHYSVLFSLSKELIKNEKSPVVLHYYDGLAHLSEPVILNIDIGKRLFSKTSGKGLIPPLDLVIKTRWTKCTSVKWNCEPIL